MHLFIDGSADPRSRIGYGCYLFIEGVYPEDKSEDYIRKNLKFKKFFPTTSTRLEMQTLLWALTEIKNRVESGIEFIIVYSDSQNIIQLPKRKTQLQLREFKTKSGDTNLNLAGLYQDIFKMLQKYQCKFVKLAGHSKKEGKNRIEKVFMQVDRAARKALRNDLNTRRE